MGQPAHHAGHGKEDREKVKGETLPGVSLLSLLECRVTYPLRDRSDRYM